MNEPAVYDPLGEAHEVVSHQTSSTNGLSSTLDDLRAAMEHSAAVAEVEFKPHYLYGPGRFIRLVCSTEIDQADMKKVQLSGLPPEQRKKRIPDPRKLDEATVFVNLIVRQCEAIELLQGDGSYKRVAGDLTDAHMLAQLGVMDPGMAVRRVFGNRDAYLVRVGQELVEACGYGESSPGETGGDEDDPT